MSLSQQKYILSSDDDDDYELPSLAERIKAFPKPRQTLGVIASDSENEDKEFLKFSEKIRNTPCSQVKFSQNVSIQKETTNFKYLKSPKMYPRLEVQSPCLNIKLDFSATSDSENEDSGIFNFPEKTQNPHQSNVVKNSEKDSDSDEMFSNTLQRLSEMCTPRVQPRNSNETSESDSDEIFSNLAERLSKIMTPKTENKENCNAVNESEDVENLQEFRTPLPPNRRNYSKGNDSDSDDSFSNFVERIRTPMSHSRKKQHEANESDSDDSFLNSARKLQAFRTPMSQRKCRRDSILMPKFSENKRMCHSTTSLSGDTSNSIKICKSENQKEFDALFPPETINSIFCSDRTASTYKLYEYFNRKIFNSQLPDNMSLKYDGSLKSTAGLTLCSYKNDIYSCSIKLSSELLTSFDRLKNTLLHEMCHAAVWVINKKQKVRHGPLWQIWASRCKLILPFVECPMRCHNYDISYSVWYHCPKCNWKKGRCKRVKKYEGAVCARCKTSIIMNFS